MIVYQHRIYRVDLVNNPRVLYVFGDNWKRIGNGGQAAEMRGEPNAVGIATKKAPGRNPEDYFTDEEYYENLESFCLDLNPWYLRPESSKVVVVPADGIGTGLSELPTRAPKTFEWLCRHGLGGVAYA